RVGEHARVFQSTTPAQESRGVVRGTEESDRAAALALTTPEVRSGTVLSGSGSTEPQATGPLLKLTHRTTGSYHLENEKNNSATLPGPHKIGPSTDFFNSHACLQHLGLLFGISEIIHP